MWRHGDVLIAAVEAIPAGAKALPHCVLAEGELTGHCHRVEGSDVAELLELGGERFLKVEAESARLVHEEHRTITSLPNSLAGVNLRWRGVPIDERIAFHPEAIEVREILEEGNAERRRVLLERVGIDRFVDEADAQVLDEDRDPGGVRRLLCVPIPQDEDLVCVMVRCPSTGGRYLLRVPPAMTTCHQAVAWTAGFDDPSLYRPLVEA